MRFSLFSQGCQFKLVSSVALVGILLSAVGESVVAQIVPDNTLGAESSVLSPLNFNIRGIESDRIEGGATRGANLFHSFQEFNVGEGRGAYFANPTGIENILTRVTGGNPSNIFGRLGVLGKANLFLLNPNGIVFGPNASLDVQGSFFATTADGVKLGDTGLFSASEPLTSNLLTINPSALLFNAIAAQPIINQSQAVSSTGQLNSSGGLPGLQVPTGQTLGLIGGDLRFEGGNLTATGGRIELGSVGGVGEVSLNQIGNRFVLGYDSIQEFGNISLSNGAFLDTSGQGGGDVQIRGQQLEMTQGSLIVANTLGAGVGGELLVKTTESVSLREGSRLTAYVDAYGTGTGGNLIIETSQLFLRDGAIVNAGTFGEGNGGLLQVTADAIEASGTSANGQFSSGLYTSTSGTGDAGNLTIDTSQLRVLDGAVVNSGSFSEGNGGFLQISADTIEASGTSANGQFYSGLLAETLGTGDAGNLTIDTSQLRVLDGARVSVSTFSQGNGGSLQVSADTIEVIGRSADNRFSSGLLAETPGTGNAGILTVDTSQLRVLDGAQVSVSTFDQGNGGSLQISADAIEVIGRSADGLVSSGLYAETLKTGTAGILTVDTSQLRLDGGVVSVSTRGQGNGGLLQIRADTIELIGRSANGQFSSGLSAETLGTGDAGNLTIDTSQLRVLDGAVVSVSTFSQGNGGLLQISADTIEVIGRSANNRFSSGLFAQTLGTGNAGILTVDTSQLRVLAGARVSTSTIGQGNGGLLQISADTIEVSGTSTDGQAASGLSAETIGTGNAGILTVDTSRLLVADGAVVSVSTFGQGNGGLLQVRADVIEASGTSVNGQFSSGLFASTSGTGAAGNLTLHASRFLVLDGAQVSVSTIGQGNGGSLQVSADTIGLIGTSANGQIPSGLFTSTSGTGDAGNLTIDTSQLLILDGGVVFTGSFGQGNGGSLQVIADVIGVIGTSADGQFSSGLYTSTGGTGDAGNLTVDTSRLLVEDGALISSVSLGQGDASNITITVSDILQVNNGTITTSTSQSTGGGITITAKQIRLFGDSNITSFVASGAGNAGNINLTADSIIAFDDSDIFAFAGDGKGGDITLDTPAFFAENYDSTSRNSDPATLDNNNRVDVNATGAISGAITTPDLSLIQNSLTELPENQIDTDSLLANSCIVRRNQPTRGSFIITGTDDLPQRPGTIQMSTFSTVDVETLPRDNPPPPSNPRRSWQKGDPIVEPQGVYRLPNGKLVLSRECPQ